ncbi:MAG: hypothetical protein ACQSGP_02715, partial [Frankia sp.]
MLGPRARLSFGRAGCDVPFGTTPQDLMISRSAGVLAESEGAIVVRNTGRHPLLLLSSDGNAQMILAPSTAQSAGMREFRVVAVGTHGQRHEIKVIHLRGGGPNQPGQDTVQPSMHLTPTERRLLAALCESRLRTGNPHEPFPTYREIALRVKRDDNYVRSRLATVRNNLAGLGVPGLAREEPGGPPRRLPDYIVRLGEWVIAAGLITRTDLIMLDSGSSGSPAAAVDGAGSDEPRPAKADEPRAGKAADQARGGPCGPPRSAPAGAGKAGPLAPHPGCAGGG